MFNVGDLVRLKTDEGSGLIAKVQEIDEDNYQSSSVRIEFEDALTEWVDPDDYEVIPSNQDVQEHKPMAENVPQRTEQEIHDDISKMFVQVIQYIRASSGERIKININCDHHSSDTNVDIEFNVGIKYDTEITSTNLFTSARVALARNNENDDLKCLSIPLYVESNTS